MFIAAHAIALEAVLVTHDKTFSHIPGLQSEDRV
jgi:predicted nucleic acid-binding protein